MSSSSSFANFGFSADCDIDLCYGVILRDRLRSVTSAVDSSDMNLCFYGVSKLRGGRPSFI